MVVKESERNGIRAKYKIIFEGEETDEYALYIVSCYNTGGEILEMSNPGDYPGNLDYESEHGIVEA